MLEVRVWMRNNQKGRRNLTDGWKFELEQGNKVDLLELGKWKLSEAGKTGGRGNIKPLSIVDKPFTDEKPHNTRNEIANNLGWSTGKVAMADKVWNQATPEVKAEVNKQEINNLGLSAFR